VEGVAATPIAVEANEADVEDGHERMGPRRLAGRLRPTRTRSELVASSIAATDAEAQA
jgi:hypothetical protein